MHTVKTAAVAFVTTAVIVAVIFRVPAVRKLVTGVA